MNNLEIFEFEDKEIRTQIDLSGNPLFCVKDVCNGLLIGNVTDATKSLKENERVSIKSNTSGGVQNMLFTTESGLYKLIMQSRKQEAQNFKDWICEGVLPSIRKTGSYSIEPPKPTYNLPTTFKEALLMLVEAEEQKEQMQLKIEQMKPKEEFYDNVINTQDSISIGKAAKILNFESGFGQNKLFEFLRNQGILTEDNIPYQKYVNYKYFEIVFSTFKKGDKNCVSTKTLVTPKGMEFIIKKYKEHSSK